MRFAPTSRDRILLAAGLAVSGVLLWLALRDTDTGEVASALGRAQLLWAGPFVVAYGAFFWIKAVRWRLLLKPCRETSARELVSPILVGAMANNLLPAQLGELLRMTLLARQLDVRSAPVLATIALERMFDLLAVLVFVSVALLDPGAPPALATAGWFVSGAGLTLLLGAVLYVGWTARFVSFARRIPGRVGARVGAELERGALGFSALTDVRAMVSVAALSLVQWALMAVAIETTLLALDIQAPAWAAFVVLAVTVAGLVLPSSPGFFGTLQLCFVLALEPWGVPAGDAVAASVMYNVLIWAPVTLVGLACLARTGSTLGSLVTAAREEA